MAWPSHSPLRSPADIHQLVQLGAAALVHVPAASVALVHQLAQQLDSIGRRFFTHLLKLQHTRGLAVHVLGPLVEFEGELWERKDTGKDVRKGCRTTQYQETCVCVCVCDVAQAS